MPKMAVFGHYHYRYFWEKCYGNPMPLFYNRNLAAEQGAAGRLVGKLE